MNSKEIIEKISNFLESTIGQYSVLEYTIEPLETIEYDIEVIVEYNGNYGKTLASLVFVYDDINDTISLLRNEDVFTNIDANNAKEDMWTMLFFELATTIDINNKK